MANEYYQLSVGINAAGQYSELDFVYRIADPTEPDDFVVASQLVAVLDDGVALSWIRRLFDCMSADCFLSSVRAKRVAPNGGNTASAIFEATDVIGDLSGDLGTQQTSGCLIWVNETDPDRTGRNFLPGVPEDMVDAGRFDIVYKTAIGLFVAKHITGFTVAAGIFLPVTFDRVTKTGLVVQDGYLSPRPGRQRRRELPI